MQIEHDNVSLYHLPPQALDVEESVLASCFLGYKDDVLNSVRPEHFYKSAHQKIFQAIIELCVDGVGIDLLTVSSHLRKQDRLEEIGGATYLARLTENIPISTNLKNHIQIIREKYILRKLIEISNKTARKCFEDSESVASIIGCLQKEVSGIEVSDLGSFISYRDLAEQEVDRYEELQSTPGYLTGTPSGFTMLDRITCGFQDTDLIIIAARTSMGKTAIAVNITGHVAGVEDRGVAYFSLEMSKSQLFARQVASHSGVNSQRFRSGNFSHQDWVKITNSVGIIYEWPVFIDDTAALHYHEIRRRAWELKKKENISLIIIDHLQHVKGDDGQTRDREIGSITAGLKALAKELDIPVILLSQLNRSLDQRNDKRPRLSDLRDSGNIEQDADVIMFIYRDEEYNDDENNPNRGIAEINIAKQRNGPTGMIRLYWREQTTTFHNMTYEP